MAKFYELRRSYTYLTEEERAHIKTVGFTKTARAIDCSTETLRRAYRGIRLNDVLYKKIFTDKPPGNDQKTNI